jgi:hypothetical protein
MPTHNKQELSWDVQLGDWSSLHRVRVSGGSHPIVDPMSTRLESTTMTRQRIRFMVLSVLAMNLLLCVSALTEDQPATVDAQAQTASNPAPATDSSSDDSWHFDATPYLWFAGASGTVGARGHDLSFHADAGDMLSHFHLGLMATVEARKNRFVMPIDFMWIDLQAAKGLSFDQGVNSVKLGVSEVVFTPNVGYRIVDHEKVKVDALVGLRYWHLGQSLNFNPPIFGGISASQNWVDGIAGGKIVMALSPKAGVTIAGDAGGGGSSLDYQVVGVFGFRVCRSAVLDLGWRYMYVDYLKNPPKQALFDAHMSGAVLGVTFNLK